MLCLRSRGLLLGGGEAGPRCTDHILFHLMDAEAEDNQQMLGSPAAQRGSLALLYAVEQDVVQPRAHRPTAERVCAPDTFFCLLHI